jgi:hemerythrin superfamily protein
MQYASIPGIRTAGETVMARSKRNGSRATSRNGRARNATSRRTTKSDAISLLKSDHREVEGWFSQFEKTNSDTKKQELAQKICAALTAHTTIEEEIFYPAFLEATDDKDIHHEAEVEHDGAKKLIAEIEAAGPDDEYYAARVTVLSEMIKHHVKEEEKRGGMFSKARGSDMDLNELGERLQQRKAEVMAEQPSRGASRPSRAKARGRLGPAMMVRGNGRGRQDSLTRRT